MNSSFLPEDYLARRLARRSNIVCVALFVVALAALTFMIFMTTQQRNQARTVNQELNRQVEEKARQIDQLAELEKKTKEQKHKASLTSSLMDRIKKSNVMAELINHMPPALSLTTLEFETKKVKTNARPRTRMAAARRKAEQDAQDQPQIVPDDVELKLVGLAPTDVDVSDYMHALSNHDLFEAIHLVKSGEKKVEDTQMRQFEITLRLNPVVGMDTLEPTRKTRGIDASSPNQGVQITPDGIAAAPVVLD